MTRTLIGAAALILAAGAASAETWTLDGANSRVGFGSVKSDVIGESHGFGGLTGTVAEDGAARVVIDLGSVDTAIDIRNERMIEHVFKMAPDAELTARIDMEAMGALGVGETMTSTVEGSLFFLGEEIYVDLPVLAARLAEDRLLVMSDGVTYVSTEELGIDEGLDALAGIAGLERIDRAVPVTVRFLFAADKSGA